MSEPTPHPLIGPGDLLRAAGTALAAFAIGQLLSIGIPVIALPSHSPIARTLALVSWAIAMGVSALPEGWVRTGRVAARKAAALAGSMGALGSFLALVTLRHATDARPGELPVTTLGALLAGLAGDPALIPGLLCLLVGGAMPPLVWTLAAQKPVEERRAQERLVALLRRGVVVAVIAHALVLLALAGILGSIASAPAVSGMEVVLVKVGMALLLPGGLLAGLVGAGAIHALEQALVRREEALDPG